jgi:hypothetical protein
MVNVIFKLVVSDAEMGADLDMLNMLVFARIPWAKTDASCAMLKVHALTADSDADTEENFAMLKTHGLAADSVAETDAVSATLKVHALAADAKAETEAAKDRPIRLTVAPPTVDPAPDGTVSVFEQKLDETVMLSPTS